MNRARVRLFLIWEILGGMAKIPKVQGFGGCCQ